MYTILAILIMIASILLVGVILIQKSKGGGLAANVNNYNQFMGVRKTTDFVEKATWGLAAFICVLSIISSFFAPKIVEGSAQVHKLPGTETQAPEFGTPAAQDAPAAQGQAAPAAQGEAAAPAAKGEAAAPAAKSEAAAPAAKSEAAAPAAPAQEPAN